MRAIIFSCFFCLLANVASGIPLLQYRFNETGTTATNSGTASATLQFSNSAGNLDLHSADGGGVSGLPGDRAFDNSASTAMGSAGVGGKGEQAHVADTDDLKSLTLQGWFNAQEVIDNVARIVDNQIGNTSFLILGSAGGLNFEINNVSSKAGSFGDVGTWVFFAVTYDGTTSTNNVHFYKGTRTSAVALVSTGSLSTGTALGNTSPLEIGNWHDTWDRPFDGLLDDLRVYGAKSDASGVLSLSELESLRTQDILNVPEASGAGILFVSIAALASRKRR